MPMIFPRDAIAMFLVLLIAGLMIGGMIISYIDRRCQADAIKRAKKALISTRGTPFHAGALAALDGSPMWDNPHATPGGAHDMSLGWHAGWCYGRQLLRQMGGQP